MFDYGIRYEKRNGKLIITSVSIIDVKTKSKIQALDGSRKADNTGQFPDEKEFGNCSLIEPNPRFCTKGIQQDRIKKTPEIRRTKDSQETRKKKESPFNLGLCRFRLKNQTGSNPGKETERNPQQETKPRSHVLFRFLGKEKERCCPGYIDHDSHSNRYPDANIRPRRYPPSKNQQESCSVQRKVRANLRNWYTFFQFYQKPKRLGVLVPHLY